jgi:hypothetical protein
VAHAIRLEGGCSGATLRVRSISPVTREHRPELGILLVHCLPRLDSVHGDRHRGRDGVTSADRLREVIAGIEEDHVDAGPNLRGEVGEYGVRHRRCDTPSRAEGLVGPAQNVERRSSRQVDSRLPDDRGQLAHVHGHGCDASSGTDVQFAATPT